MAKKKRIGKSEMKERLYPRVISARIKKEYLPKVEEFFTIRDVMEYLQLPQIEFSTVTTALSSLRIEKLIKLHIGSKSWRKLDESRD